MTAILIWILEGSALRDFTPVAGTTKSRVGKKTSLYPGAVATIELKVALEMTRTVLIAVMDRI